METEKKGTWGGKRSCAGRKATGSKTKTLSITLPIEAAELLKLLALSNNMTVSDYISHELNLER